ncbi:MAG: hypothetical protein V5804_05545 [Mucilaginibacter sp.]|uniref:hypothetical protein n=1 Tax=Mucilaginibacter sp. TaxID=1882438 RepID=UPI0034E3E0D4
MITKKDIAEKLLDHLQHKLTSAELVDWAEKTLMGDFYEDDQFHTIRNVLAQLGLADVKAFGLEYQDCEAIMQKLGYTLEVKALAVA